MAHTEAASVCEQSVCWHTLVISPLVRHGVFEGFFYISHLIFSVQNSRGTKRCQTRADLTGQRKRCVFERPGGYCVSAKQHGTPVSFCSCYIYTVRLNAQRWYFHTSDFVQCVNVQLEEQWKTRVQNHLLLLMSYQNGTTFFNRQEGKQSADSNRSKKYVIIH